MRKVTVISMITLDGVMQGPGGPEEDTSGGFTAGGWTAGYGDEVFAETLARQMAPADLLLGRKTFEIFSAYWPDHADGWPGVNDATKYVVSGSVKVSEWSNTVFLPDVAAVRDLRESDGPELHVWGSGELTQALLANDLVDELWLTVFPVTLGEGTRLFDRGAASAAFTLNTAAATPSGLIIATYTRAGQVEFATIGA